MLIVYLDEMKLSLTAAVMRLCNRFWGRQIEAEIFFQIQSKRFLQNSDLRYLLEDTFCGVIYINDNDNAYINWNNTRPQKSINVVGLQTDSILFYVT